MKSLLKKSCPDCTESTISTYYHTIRSLAKLAEVNGVPLNHEWITDELLRKVKAVPKKTTSKNLAVAAIKPNLSTLECHWRHLSPQKAVKSF